MTQHNRAFRTGQSRPNIRAAVDQYGRGFPKLRCACRECPPTLARDRAVVAQRITRLQKNVATDRGPLRAPNARGYDARRADPFQGSTRGR